MGEIYIDKEELRGKSQTDRVLWFLEKYGKITNLQCHEFLGIRHCPSVIRDLKKKLAGTDLTIVSEKKEGSDRFGNKTWWNDYILIEIGKQRSLF